MSELAKVNKFSDKVSPKGEPKLFLVYPGNRLVRAYTEEEVKDYMYKSYDHGRGILLEMLSRHLEITEVEIIDITEGDEPHS